MAAEPPILAGKPREVRPTRGNPPPILAGSERRSRAIPKRLLPILLATSPPVFTLHWQNFTSHANTIPPATQARGKYQTNAKLIRVALYQSSKRKIRLQVVSNFGVSGEIHTRARKWAPARRLPRDASPRGSPCSRACVYFAGNAKIRVYSQSKEKFFKSLKQPIYMTILKNAEV